MISDSEATNARLFYFYKNDSFERKLAQMMFKQHHEQGYWNISRKVMRAGIALGLEWRLYSYSEKSNFVIGLIVYGNTLGNTNE